MLPVLGDMDPSAVEMSEKEIEVEQALMARSNTRINAWSFYFAQGTDNLSAAPLSLPTGSVSVYLVMLLITP